MTALMPSKGGALGGPVPGGAGAVFLATQHDQRGTFSRVGHGRIVVEHLFFFGNFRVKLPCLGVTSWFLMRMLPKVPRIITSWLPRREP
jgi:hypothetical protein